MPLSKNLYLKFIVLLSWIYPKAGAALAEKLFLTPTRVPRPASESEFFETAKKYTLPHGIAAFEWGDESHPLVVLVHGWSGRGTQMGAFSAGCSVLSVQRGLKVKKLVLIAGPAKYERVVNNFFKLLPISKAAQGIFLVNLQRKVGISVKDMDVGLIGSHLRVEAMVVHDVDDKEVRFVSATEIQEAWPSVKIFKTQGLGHRRILRDPHVLDTVTEFLRA